MGKITPRLPSNNSKRCSADQGWEIEEGNLVAIMTDYLSAPEMSIGWCLRLNMRTIILTVTGANKRNLKLACAQTAILGSTVLRTLIGIFRGES